MSDKQTIVGTCTEISEKSGWTTFHIDKGSQYPVKLSTKLEKRVAKAREVGQQEATWTFSEKESETINEHTGKPYVNRYLEDVTVGEVEAPPQQREAGGAPPPQHTPLAPGDKDRAITRMACLRSAAQTLTAAPDTDPAAAGDRVIDLAARYERWVYRDVDDIPF